MTDSSRPSEARIRARNCRRSNLQFADRAACDATCDDYPDGYWYDTTGDTVHCRIFQASFSAAQEPDMYCPLAGENSSVCFNP